MGGSRNTDGYGQVFTKKNSQLRETGRAAQTAFLLHRVAFVSKTGRDVQEQGSHLCDNPACFRPDHIVDETSLTNNSRKGCPGILVCGWHHHVLADLCIHRPQCLRPERREGLSCCLAIKESDPEGWASHHSSSEVGGSSQRTNDPSGGENSGLDRDRDVSMVPSSPPVGGVDSGPLPIPSRCSSAHSSTDYGSFPDDDVDMEHPPAFPAIISNQADTDDDDTIRM